MLYFATQFGNRGSALTVVVAVGVRVPSVFDLNLRHLEAAAEIVRVGSFSAASQVVGLSQPALTQALQKLETQLATSLFDRHAGGASATAAGKLLAHRTTRALALITEAAKQPRGAAHRPPLGPAGRHFTMGQLRALFALARTGTYVAAARSLGLSEPSVHRAVRDLQLMLGVGLAERAGRNVRLTPLAQDFMRPARLAIAELEAGLAELAALDGIDSGSVAVGGMPLACAALLPATVARFTAANTRARIRIVDGPYPDLLAALCHGELDCLVGALRDPVPASDVVQIPLFVDRLYVVVRRAHPLRDADVEGLARYPWIVAPAGTPLRKRFEALFNEPGLRSPPVAMECSSVAAIRGLLLRGNWLSLLSADQFALEKQAGLLRPLGGPVANSARTIGLTTRRSWQPTALQASFIACLTEQVAKANTSGKPIAEPAKR